MSWPWCCRAGQCRYSLPCRRKANREVVAHDNYLLRSAYGVAHCSHVTWIQQTGGPGKSNGAGLAVTLGNPAWRSRAQAIGRIEYDFNAYSAQFHGEAPAIVRQDGNKFVSKQTAKKEGQKSTEVIREFLDDKVIQTMKIVGSDLVCVQEFKRL